MKHKILNRFGPWVALFCLIALAVYAANPSFSSFNTNQFTTAGNIVQVKSGATVTNTAIWSTALNPLTVHGGQGFKFLYSDDVTPIAFMGGTGDFFTGSGTVTNGLTNRLWSANTLLGTDGGKGSISVTAGTGLTYDTVNSNLFCNLEVDTNSVNTGVIPAGKVTTTNLTGNITLAGLSGGTANKWNTAILIATNGSGSDKTVTLMAGCTSIDGGRTYTTTNNSQRIFSFGWEPGVFTNCASQPSY